MISNDDEADEAVRKILGSRGKDDKSKSKRSCEPPLQNVAIQRPIPIFTQNAPPQPAHRTLPTSLQHLPSITSSPPYTMAMNLSTVSSYPTTTPQPHYQHTLTYTTIEQDNHHPHHVTTPGYTCQYVDYSNYEYSDTEGLEKALGLDFTGVVQRELSAK